MKCIALVVALGLAGFSSWLPSFGAEASNPEEGKLKRVYSVTEVTVRTLESFPEQLQIEARGETRTGGWTSPQLRQTKYEGDKGLLALEFVGTPPQGIASQALTPIRATLTIRKPADYKGVQVIAETNTKTTK